MFLTTRSYFRNSVMRLCVDDNYMTEETIFNCLRFAKVVIIIIQRDIYIANRPFHTYNLFSVYYRFTMCMNNTEIRFRSKQEI